MNPKGIKMSISTGQLESIKKNLLHLQAHLKAERRAPDTELHADERLLAEATECDFMLPSPLTLASLAEAVTRKLENVDVLLERSRTHETLPPQAQAAAEDENRYMEEDYKDEPRA